MLVFLYICKNFKAVRTNHSGAVSVAKQGKLYGLCYFRYHGSKN
jgi:hypothetical protein